MGQGPNTYTVGREYARGGFRYLSLINNGTGDIELAGLSVYFTAAPTQDLQAYSGYFHSNDELLNRVWYAGAYTNRESALLHLLLNMSIRGSLCFFSEAACSERCDEKKRWDELSRRFEFVWSGYKVIRRRLMLNDERERCPVGVYTPCARFCMNREVLEPISKTHIMFSRLHLFTLSESLLLISLVQRFATLILNLETPWSTNSRRLFRDIRAGMFPMTC